MRYIAQNQRDETGWSWIDEKSSVWLFVFLGVEWAKAKTGGARRR